jgi:hypothetical protein
MGYFGSIASGPDHSSHEREVASLSPLQLRSQWKQANDISDLLLWGSMCMLDNGKKSKHLKTGTCESSSQFGFSKLTSLNKLQPIATVDCQLFIKFYKKNKRMISMDKGK